MKYVTIDCRMSLLYRNLYHKTLLVSLAQGDCVEARGRALLRAFRHTVGCE